MNDLIGGRYRIEGKLGAGGMGAVYEATDTLAPKAPRVALKVVTAEVAKDEVLLGRFEREVRVARGLNTPHIVRALDAGRDAFTALPFLVMELLLGEDMQRLVRRIGPLEPDLALKIVAQACLGLEVAHAAGIVHRDIKPANLFLAEGPREGERTVKILDFGIAKLAPDRDDMRISGEITSLTQTGSMLGSPLFMAPEQARGRKDIDGRADLWSLGVVLYRAITGRTPHEADALGDLIIAICTEPAEPIEKVAPWVSPGVAAIVRRALTLDPTTRFQSAREMFEAIVELLPDGYAVRESMFVPISEPRRELLAAFASRMAKGVATISEPPPGAKRSDDVATRAEPRGPSKPPERDAHHAVETPAAMHIDTHPPASRAGGLSGPSSSAKTPPTKPRRRSAFAFAAAVIVMIGAGLMFMFASRAPGPSAGDVGHGTESRQTIVPGPTSALEPRDVPGQTGGPASSVKPEVSSVATAPRTIAMPPSAKAGAAASSTTKSGSAPLGSASSRGAAAAPTGTNDIWLGR